MGGQPGGQDMRSTRPLTECLLSINPKVFIERCLQELLSGTVGDAAFYDKVPVLRRGRRIKAQNTEKY